MLKATAAAVIVAVIGVVSLFAYSTLRTPAEASGQLQAVSVDTATGQPGALASDVLKIDQSASQARFVVDEVLRGAPFTVVGATNQVAGAIVLDAAQPQATKIGMILINARTLATDSAQRDKAIKNRILNTDQFELVTFTPNAIDGLPAAIEPGQSFPIKIAGGLTIRDVTRDVVFDATITPISDDELTGTASTTIKHADWGLAIPEVPFVAGVSDQVRLELDFTARTG